MTYPDTGMRQVPGQDEARYLPTAGETAIARPVVPDRGTMPIAAVNQVGPVTAPVLFRALAAQAGFFGQIDRFFAFPLQICSRRPQHRLALTGARRVCASWQHQGTQHQHQQLERLQQQNLLLLAGASPSRSNDIADLCRSFLGPGDG